MNLFNNFRNNSLFAAIIFCTLTFFGCSSNKNEQKEQSAENPEIAVVETEPEEEAQTAPKHGVGPVESVDLTDEIDAELATTGEGIFQTKCVACHSFDQKLIGPAMKDVTERRNPAWIMNMILNPMEMTQKDPIAKALLEEYGAQMVNMNVTKEDARAILEYLRQQDKQG